MYTISIQLNETIAKLIMGNYIQGRGHVKTGSKKEKKNRK